MADPGFVDEAGITGRAAALFALSFVVSLAAYTAADLAWNRPPSRPVLGPGAVPGPPHTPKTYVASQGPAWTPPTTAARRGDAGAERPYETRATTVES